MVNKDGTIVSKPKGAIHKSTKEKQAIQGLMRNDVLHYLMQMPLRDFAKKNPQLLEFVELTFGKAVDEFTVGVAVGYQNIGDLIMNPNMKNLSFLLAEMYGKIKEASEAKTIELPQMQDESDIINNLDTKTLEMILAQRKSLEAPKETFQPKEEFELISM